jgi:oligopeptide/dipeptide ABC transporter ATP-binding protein
VLGSPRHPYTQALLASVPQIESAPARPQLLRGTIEVAPQPVKGCRFEARCPHKLGAVCENMVPTLQPLSTTHSVACRRSEFAAILKNEGIDGLNTALNRKADILTGTTAKAF